jgi:SAM-dependent methyltransferase
MTTHPRLHNPACDVDAAADEAALAQGLAVSGADNRDGVRGRLAWLAACLRQLGEPPTTVMDYGCGIGAATPAFFAGLGVTAVVGTDRAPRAVDVARQAYGSECARLLLFDHDHPHAALDLVYCHGVFHHLLPYARVAAVAYVWQASRPGGLWAFWEHNPWHLGTRSVMHRRPCDRDAIPLTPPEARGSCWREALRFSGPIVCCCFPGGCNGCAASRRGSHAGHWGRNIRSCVAGHT